MFAIIRTRWQTRPLSRRAKRRSSAAPGSLRKKYAAILHPQTWYTCSSTLPHLGITGSRYNIIRRCRQRGLRLNPTAYGENQSGVQPQHRLSRMTTEGVTEIVDPDTPQSRDDANQQELRLRLGRTHVSDRGRDGLPKEREEQQETADPDLDQHN